MLIKSFSLGFDNRESCGWLDVALNATLAGINKTSANDFHVKRVGVLVFGSHAPLRLFSQHKFSRVSLILPSQHVFPDWLLRLSSVVFLSQSCRVRAFLSFRVPINVLYRKRKSQESGEKKASNEVNTETDKGNVNLCYQLGIQLN